MSEYGGLMVCTACRPALVQRVLSGTGTQPSVLYYAGFWIRFAAVFVDAIILNVVTFAFSYAMGWNPQRIFQFDADDYPYDLESRMQVITFGLSVIYEIVCTAQMGGTPGKRLFGLRVVTADGLPVSYLRSTGRYFAKWISSLICGIGYIIAAFDGKKRALHDMICSTRVVKE